MPGKGSQDLATASTGKRICRVEKTCRAEANETSHVCRYVMLQSTMK